MSDFLRTNWFVVVIAVILISFISYFIYDANRYNVSTKSSDGKDVVASVEGKDVTADDLYDELANFDSSLLYNMYHNAIIDETIETTDEMKDDAKSLEQTILSNAKSSADDYETTLTSELAQYGYTSIDELYDYCLMTIKEKEMSRLYVDDHFDELKTAVQAKNPRTISIISMSVTDADELTDDEQEKKDNIDNALKDGKFSDAATSFSEDTNTASNKGFYGYIDEDSLTSTSNLDSSIITAALDLNKGETSDWITVTDTYGYTTLYKVHVNQTDVKKIYNSKNEDVFDSILYAFVQDNDGLDMTILEYNADKLDIKFNNKKVKKKIENYIESQKGDAE